MPQGSMLAEQEAPAGQETADNVVALRPGLPTKHRECGEWQSAIDVLNDCIADIRSGRIDPKLIFIGMMCKSEFNGTVTESYPYYSYGGSSISEVRGLIAELLINIGR